MKNNLLGKLAVVCCAGIVIFSFGKLGAIPNTFGGFINQAGMRLEDFAARKAMWEPNADLKGTWELWKDEAVTDPAIELFRLKLNAVVFGVTASEVTVQRKDDRIIQFQVVFEPSDRKTSLDKLDRTLKTNASLWSGASASSKAMKHGASLYSFRSNEEEKQVVLTIKPSSEK